MKFRSGTWFGMFLDTLGMGQKEKVEESTAKEWHRVYRPEIGPETLCDSRRDRVLGTRMISKNDYLRTPKSAD